MPKFGSASKARLVTCDPRLIVLFDEVVKQMDCTILCGHRDEKEQKKAFDEGKSLVQWPYGKHNTKPAKAIDVAPYPINWSDKPRFYIFAGLVLGIASQMGIKIRWGGDWDNDKDFDDQTFDDLVHFEILDF